MAPVPGGEWRSGRIQSVVALRSWYVRHLKLIQTTRYNVSPSSYNVSFQFIMSPTVPVGGPLTVRYEYDIGENYAVIGLRVYCKAAKGSHPRYQWFLNKTPLHNQGSFYHVVNQPPEQSILLLAVGRSSAGIYHCEVSDSFDNKTAIKSKARRLNKEGTVDPLLFVFRVEICLCHT